MERGDTLSVVSMVFDPEGKAEAKQELEEIKKKDLKEHNKSSYWSSGSSSNWSYWILNI